MDRRREPRSALNQPVWITVLGTVESPFSGTALDLSGRGMRLMSAQPLAPDTPVKVETADSLYLAEVCYCIPQHGEFLIGLAVDQVLTGLPDLARLRLRLAEDVGQPAVVSR